MKFNNWSTTYVFGKLITVTSIADIELCKNYTNIMTLNELDIIGYVKVSSRK